MKRGSLRVTITTDEAAAMAGVSPVTIRSWGDARPVRNPCAEEHDH